MSGKELEREYNELVERRRLEGGADEARPQAERRRHPRIHPEAAELLVDDDPWVYVINVSKTGLAYFTDSPPTVGSTVRIAVAEQAPMSVRVVSCSVEPGEPASLAGQYRVSCAFPDESAGLRFMLELRTHEQAHLDTPIVQVMA